MAQDSESRHVVIKVLLSDSEEFRVLELLQQEKDLQQFHGVIPVLDMLSFGVFQFVILPRCVRRNSMFSILEFYGRWGDTATCSWFETAEDVLHYIRCLLKVFLSSHSTAGCLILCVFRASFSYTADESSIVLVNFTF